MSSDIKLCNSLSRYAKDYPYKIMRRKIGHSCCCVRYYFDHKDCDMLAPVAQKRFAVGCWTSAPGGTLEHCWGWVGSSWKPDEQKGCEKMYEKERMNVAQVEDCCRRG